MKGQNTMPQKPPTQQTGVMGGIARRGQDMMVVRANDSKAEGIMFNTRWALPTACENAFG